MRLSRQVPQPKNARQGMRGCTLNELLFFILFFFCVISGFGLGYEIGSTHGTTWGILGSIIGLALGIAAPFLLVLVVSTIRAPIQKRKRREYSEATRCENGICSGDDHHYEETPKDLYNTIRGLSPVCERCNCGNVYVSLATVGAWHRVRILPDGSLKPYKMQKMFGDWQMDDGVWLEDWLKKSGEPENKKEFSIPDWTLPWVMTAFFVGIACLAVLANGGFSKPFAVDFLVIAFVASLITGYGIILHRMFQEHRRKWADAHPEEAIAREKRKERTEPLREFLFFKIASLLPATGFIMNTINTEHGGSGVDFMGMAFFGIWFIAFFFTCGLSYREYRDKIDKGMNRYCYLIAGAAYAVLALLIMGGMGLTLTKLLLYGKEAVYHG